MSLWVSPVASVICFLLRLFGNLWLYMCRGGDVVY